MHRSLIFFTIYLLPIVGFSFDKWYAIERMVEKNQWQQIINTTKDSDDIEAQCYYNLAKQKFFLAKREVIQAIWLVPYSQPKACNHLFKFWSDNNLISQKEYLDRIIMSLSHDRVRLAKYLAKSLHDQSQLSDLLKIYNAPKSIVSLSQIKKMDENTLVFAIERTAEKYSADSAETIYQMIKQKQILLPKNEAKIAEILSMHYALQGSYKTNFWFQQIDPSQAALSTFEWQIRYHLKKKNWLQVKNIILTSPKEILEKPVWQYWLAQSFQKIGKTLHYTRIMKKVSQEREFYGMVAAIELNRELPFNNDPQPIKHYEKNSLKKILTPIKNMHQNRKHNSSRSNWIKVLNHMSEQDRYVAAHLANQWQLPELSIKTSKTLDKQDDLSIRFPKHYQSFINQCSKKHQIPKEYIYAMIRQESAFQKDAKSADGAMGLMQLLPNTAKYIAKRKHITNYRNLLDPQKNIQLGCSYLGYLVDKYDKNILLALAAYNMGPGNLSKFVPKDNQTNLIWLETLPRIETRHYIKNLITYKLIYEHLDHKKPTLNILSVSSGFKKSPN